MNKSRGCVRSIAIIALLTLLIGIAFYSIDHAYFEYPLGNGVVGISAKDNIKLPATTEISFTAFSTDPIQIDLGAKSNDLTAQLELIDPNDQVCLQKDFTVKKYPSSFVPHPNKWVTVYTANRGAGEYKLRITQYKTGQINVYFYQGPFILRFLLLPLVATFLYFLYVFTFGTSKKKAISNHPNSSIES